MVDNLLYYAPMKSPQEFAVIVVGGGHAGCEAALAAARMGVETALITSRLDALARMPCNPSIGGLAKSHLVCELDALGGEMGRNADLTALLAKTLNLSRGPAVWATRCQCAKTAYSQRMQAVLAAQPHLTLIEDDVIDLLLSVAKDAAKDSPQNPTHFIPQPPNPVNPVNPVQSTPQPPTLCASVSLCDNSTPKPPNPVNPVKNLLNRGRLPIVARACAGGDDNRNRPQSPLRLLRLTYSPSLPQLWYNSPNYPTTQPTSMPELPEAESIARALDRALAGRVITKVEVFFPRLRTPLAPLLSAGLPGRRILGCRRRARYAVADLDDGRALVLHFGMSGVARVEDARRPRRKHEHVVVTLDDGRALKFEDPRRFGAFEVQELGPDG